ncbi:phosphotransferase [Amycolatopsis rhizosphaerae]|uniref:Phosphotransferase n=1 Tax=Amycolatopsis rhizosphaerae TaxID=2053003 RepID=A0A558B9A0_9PSEU|nr:phosphotransferase [Amycolatopsis rhizosphaerae]TVT33083.1 phosphotransferase [Amycolatopsis rhizosphaerae]
MVSVPPPSDELPSIVDWLRDRLADDHPTDLPPGAATAPRAERTHALHILDQLTADFRPGLCHGDASPWNILASTNGEWRLIDPRGMYGEPEYDAAVLAMKIEVENSASHATMRVAKAGQLDNARIHA